MPTKKTIEILSDRSAMTKITVDNLNQGGVYLIELIEITDNNGCTKSLSNTRAVVVEVFSNLPTVSFHSSKPVYVLEGGKTFAGLYIYGRGPFELEYSNRDHPEFVYKTIINVGDVGLTLEAGRYELLKFKDSLCAGYIGEASEIEGDDTLINSSSSYRKTFV